MKRSVTETQNKQVHAQITLWAAAAHIYVVHKQAFHIYIFVNLCFVSVFLDSYDMYPCSPPREEEEEKEEE